MEYKGDTISAISTPAGVGGISVLRVSGTKAIEVVDSIFHSKKSIKDIPSHKAAFGRITDDEQLIDEVQSALQLYRRRCGRNFLSW